MGGKSSTSTQSVNIPPEVMARYNAVNARAETVAQTPFQQYGGQFVAGMTPTQQAGIQGTNMAAQTAQPYYGVGAGLTMAGAQDVGALTRGQIGYYQDPAMLATLGPTYQALRQQQGQQLSQQQAEAIRGGAFGGDRSGLQRAALMGQQQLGMGQALAPIYQQAYQTGLQTAQQQQGVVAQDLQRRLAAGQQIAGLGTGAQQAALQGAQAQLQAGTAEQQTQQADLTARYQQFLQERGYPFQTAQFLANIAMGTGALSGSTTTTTQPSGFFSDKRLKHDAKRIGETDDGLPIYSYKYNGDDKTQIGLMAQDVEKKRPEAVGLAPAADGKMYKTVDYEKATRRGRDAGGLIPSDMDANSMGGAVDIGSALEAFARGGYALGGSPLSDVDLQAVLKSQQQFLNPYAANAPYGQQAGAPGGKGYVPQAALPTTKLITAGSLPQQQKSGAMQALDMGKSIASTYQTGKELKGDIGDAYDWVKKKIAPAATGGLIVPRHGYEDGGDVIPGMPDDKENDTQNKTTNPAGVPSSGFPSDVLTAGSKHADLATAKGGLGPQSSGLKDVASAIGAGKSLFEGGKWLMGLFAADGGRINPYAYGGLIAREHHANGEETGNASVSLFEQPVERREEPAPNRGLVVREERPAQATETPPVDDRLERTMNAIRRIESGGRYDITGPASRKGDKPYGAYQVMGANIPSWTEAALGKRMTPEEFLADSEAQDKTARHRLGLYLQEHGDPRQAASMWFSGRPMEKAGNVTDVLGTSVPKYVDMFNRYYGGEDLAPAQDTGAARRPGVIPTGVEGQFAGVPAGKASLGDVVREYAPKGTPTSENLWVPALGFLGSMLASKSPFLGQAIGEGLVGGVGAYTALNKQQADIARTQAETKLTEAEVPYRQEQTKAITAGLYERRWIPSVGMVVFNKATNEPPFLVTDANLQPVKGTGFEGNWQQIPLSPGSQPPPSSKDAGAAQPGKQAIPGLVKPGPGGVITSDITQLVEPPKSISDWKPVTKVPDGYLPPEHVNVQFDPEQAKDALARGSELVQSASQKSDAAGKQRIELEQMLNNLDKLPGGFFGTAGTGAKTRLEYAKILNTAAGIIGTKPFVDPNIPAAQEAIEKGSFRLGAALANSIGSREPGFIVAQSVGANPTIENTDKGFRLLAAGLREQARYEEDKAKYYRNYLSKFRSLEGAEETFKQINPPEFYAHRAVTSAVDPAIIADLKKYGPDQMRPFIDKQYGNGITNILMGGK